MARKTTDQVTTIGIDIGKNAFHLIDLNGSWLFSNSGMGCQALRGVPAGFTVLSAVGALALRMMALEGGGGSMCESRWPH
jgi:hypothetical protein